MHTPTKPFNLPGLINDINQCISSHLTRNREMSDDRVSVTFTCMGKRVTIITEPAPEEMP